MELILDFDDRLYNDIQSFCSFNGLEMNEYLIGLIQERHVLTKYGDLNKILPKVVEESTVSPKKRVRKKKETTTEETSDNVKTEESTEALIVTEEKQENADEVVKEVKEELPKPTIKRKRSIKTL